jgi:hypothetical protein
MKELSSSERERKRENTGNDEDRRIFSLLTLFDSI